MTPDGSKPDRVPNAAVEDWLRLMSESGRSCRLWMTDRSAADIFDELPNHSPRRIMCSTLSDALTWKPVSESDQDTTEVLLTELPADGVVATGILELACATRVIASIDHYYHAELLSRAAQRRQLSQGVVIEVDVGGHRTGVRPGMDAQRLASAVIQLPGLQLAGLSADLTALENLPAEQRPQAEQNALSVLRHTRMLIQRSGAACELVSVLTGRQDSEALRNSVVNELRWAMQPGLLQHDSPAVEQLLLSPPPLATRVPDADAYRILEARVISRPTLVQAVIQCGWRAWAGIAESPESRRQAIPAVIGIEGAVIRSVGPDTMVLRVAGPAQDLIIGDTVQLAISRH